MKTKFSLTSLLVIAGLISVIFFCITSFFSAIVILAGGVAIQLKMDGTPQTVTDTAGLVNTTLSPESTDLQSMPSFTSTVTETLQANPTITPTISETPEPSATYTPTITSSPTIDPTEQANSISGIISQLFDSQLLTTDEGLYHTIEGYEVTWNQANSYQKTYTGYDSPNFVMRFDATWKINRDEDNWSEAGCGLIFHEDEAENHYLILVTNNRAYLYRRMNGGLSRVGVSYRYEIGDELISQAKVMVVVEDNWITIFINDEEVYHFQHPYLEDGKIAFTAISGSTGGDGITCTYSNIELWEIQK